MARKFAFSDSHPMRLARVASWRVGGWGYGIGKDDPVIPLERLK